MHRAGSVLSLKEEDVVAVDSLYLIIQGEDLGKVLLPPQGGQTAKVPYASVKMKAMHPVVGWDSEGSKSNSTTASVHSPTLKKSSPTRLVLDHLSSFRKRTPPQRSHVILCQTERKHPSTVSGSIVVDRRAMSLAPFLLRGLNNQSFFVMCGSIAVGSASIRKASRPCCFQPSARGPPHHDDD